MQHSNERYRIAVIDDSPENLTLISTILAPSYEVRCTKDSTHALDFINTTDPDLILLDAVMPGKDGFTVLKEIRANDETKDIPVIFLTALTDDKHEQRALELGAVDFIRKPFNPVIMRARLQTQTELLSGRREVERLLESTLPRKVIQDLRTHGAYAPEIVKSATLIFTDLVDFTSKVAHMDACDVINELTDLFSEFDRITERGSRRSAMPTSPHAASSPSLRIMRIPLRRSRWISWTMSVTASRSAVRSGRSASASVPVA
jgi:CheY-like chemotaxis protein